MFNNNKNNVFGLQNNNILMPTFSYYTSQIQNNIYYCYFCYLSYATSQLYFAIFASILFIQIKNFTQLFIKT